MTKEELITEIRIAFKKVTLEDGIGLWEGQGLDDYADAKTMAGLRAKDERDLWDIIPYKDCVECASSLSFFDAKGMRFCLPKFLIFDLSADQIYEEQGIHSPDVLFTLSNKINGEYKNRQFSLFDSRQIQCVIHFLEYKLEEVIAKHQTYSVNYGSAIDSVQSDYDYIELNRTIDEWKQKLPPTSIEQ